MRLEALLADRVRLRRLSTRCGVLTLPWLLFACGGGGGGGDATGSSDAGTPEACGDMAQKFRDGCGGSSCHGTTQPAAGLNLESPGVEDRVSGRPATQCAGLLADPSDPEGSVIYQKLAPDVSCGGQMPLGGEAYTEAELECVRQWISGLLPPSEDDDDGPSSSDSESGAEGAEGSDSSSSTGGDTGGVCDPAIEDCPDAECEPDETLDCYTGPLFTDTMGLCQGGTRTCGSDGRWGDCDGQVLPLGENCNTPEDENCDGRTPACSELWSMGFGTAASQAMRSVAVDSTNAVIVLGDFEDRINFGTGPIQAEGDKADLVLAKYDHNGNTIWVQTFGDSSNQYGGQVTVDAADNIIIVGRAFGVVDFGGSVLDGIGTDDVFVAKFSADGTHVWSRLIGGADPDRSEAVAVDAMGDVYVVGTFTGEVDFGPGPVMAGGQRDVFLVRLAADTGAPVFSRNYGGAGDNYGSGVGVDAAGGVYISGRFATSIDFGGGAINSAGDDDMFVAKLDGNGDHVWSRGYGDTGPDHLFDLAVDLSEGSVIAAGYMSGTIDFGAGDVSSAGSRDLVFVKHGLDGALMFAKAYGDSSDNFETDFDTNTWGSVAVASDSRFIYAGPMAGGADFDGNAIISAGKPDATLVTFSAAGSATNAQRFGRTGTEIALDGAIDSSGHVVMVGRMFGTTLDFGTSGNIDGRGSSDGFLVRLQP